MSELATVKLVAGCELLIKGAVDLLTTHMKGRRVTILHGSLGRAGFVENVYYTNNRFYFHVRHAYSSAVGEYSIGELDFYDDTPLPAGSAGHPLPQGEREEAPGGAP